MDLIVRQISGLGNQLFQYAAGLFYARQHNARLSLAIDPPRRALSHGYPRPFLLSHFQIPIPMRPLTWQERIFFSGDRRLGPLSRALKLAGGVEIAAESAAQTYHFLDRLPLKGTPRTAYLVGYWQVHQIAAAVEAQLRQDLRFRAAPTGKTLDVLGDIDRAGDRAVSLHVRRGDYTLAVEGNRALPLGYYHEAMAAMRARLGTDPTFFVFSDDIAFARAHLPTHHTVFVDHNDDSTSYDDLRLMSACRHHILANSSFSWWGAWLNPSPGKQVFAPRFWAQTPDSDFPDLLPPSWTRLDNLHPAAASL